MTHRNDKPKPEDPEQPDPLIDEIREIRRSISERYSNDVDKLCDHLQDVEKQYAHLLVREVPTAEYDSRT